MNWEALPRQVPIKATEMTHPLACVACVQRVVGAKPPRMDDFEKFELCRPFFASGLVQWPECARSFQGGVRMHISSEIGLPPFATAGA